MYSPTIHRLYTKSHWVVTGYAYARYIDTLCQFPGTSLEQIQGMDMDRWMALIKLALRPHAICMAMPYICMARLELLVISALLISLVEAAGLRKPWPWGHNPQHDKSDSDKSSSDWMMQSTYTEDCPWWHHGMGGVVPGIQ